MSSAKKNQKNDDAILEEKINEALDTLELSQSFDTPDKREAAKTALTFIQDEVRKSTEAMSSVPKPLKYMRPHYDRVKEIYETSKNTQGEEAQDCRRLMADLMSVLSTTLPSKPPHLTNTGLIHETVENVLEARASGVVDPAEACLSLFESQQKLLDQKRSEAELEENAGSVRQSVAYRLEGNASHDLMAFGYEYTRSLQMDLLCEYKIRVRDEEDEHMAAYEQRTELGGLGRFETNEEVVEELLKMGTAIVESHFSSGSFIDATDFLLELDAIDRLPEIIKQYSHEVVNPLRVAEYLSQTARYERSHEAQMQVFDVACRILVDASLFCDAFNILIVAYSAAIIDRPEFHSRLVKIFDATYRDTEKGQTFRLQMLFHLCYANLHRMMTAEEREEILSNPNPDQENEDEKSERERVLSFALTHEHYRVLYKELDLTEPKHPDDVYKTYLDNYNGSENLDSANKNLASSYVSGFVHASYQNDMIVNPAKGSTTGNTCPSKQNDRLWIHKNKDKGGIAAAAAVMGALHLWNMEEGLDIVDPYLSSTDPAVQGGGYIGWGLVCSQMISDFDPLLHTSANILIDEDVEESDAKPIEGEETTKEVKSVDKFVKLCSLVGLGLAYGGSYKQELLDTIESICVDTDADDLSLSYNAALAMGLSHVGASNDTVCESISQVILDLNMRENSPLDKDYDGVFLALGLALNFLGSGEDSDTIGQLLGTMGDKCVFRKGAMILLEACAYVGSCETSIVQRFLRVISDGADVDKEEELGAENINQEEDKDKKKKKSINQDIDRRLAVIGIALVCLGDPVGQQMMLKYAESLIQYGDIQVVRTIPLALAITFASNPQNMVMDLLSKMAHDTDAETALTAILSLAIVAAGTNNARAAKMFRQLALFYSKSNEALFLVRVGQGMVHLGKGLLTISPMTFGGEVIRKPALAHLLVVVMTAFNMQKHLLEGHHHLYLWHILAAANPRMLMLLHDTSLEPAALSLRVGQAVNTVGVAGNPRGVTGFQTHASPVVLGQGEQAEIDKSAFETEPLEGEEPTELGYSTVTSRLEGIVLVTEDKPVIAAEK